MLLALEWCRTLPLDDCRPQHTETSIATVTVVRALQERCKAQLQPVGKPTNRFRSRFSGLYRPDAAAKSTSAPGQNGVLACQVATQQLLQPCNEEHSSLHVTKRHNSVSKNGQHVTQDIVDKADIKARCDTWSAQLLNSEPHTRAVPVSIRTPAATRAGHVGEQQQRRVSPAVKRASHAPSVPLQCTPVPAASPPQVHLLWPSAWRLTCRQSSGPAQHSTTQHSRWSHTIESLPHSSPLCASHTDMTESLTATHTRVCKLRHLQTNHTPGRQHRKRHKDTRRDTRRQEDDTRRDTRRNTRREPPYLHDAPLSVLAGDRVAVDESLRLAIAAVAVHTHADPGALWRAIDPVPHVVTRAAGSRHG